MNSNKNLKDKISGIILVLLCFFFIFTCVSIMSPNFSYNDPDSFWHIKVGQEMIENHNVATTATNTFAGENLHYVPHEIGFQIITALLYNQWGWAGTYLLTSICLFFLIWGLIKLSNISRKEMGLEENHPFMFLFIILITILIYVIYFKVRPQEMSAPIILWFVVFLRQMQLKPTYTKAFILGLLSLALSNVHTGVWLIIFVFTIMALIESIFYKRITKKHIVMFFAIVIGGLLNYGGVDTLLYVVTVKNYTDNFITEWTPINFAKIYFLFFTAIVFFVSASFSLNKNLFRFMFFLGIAYLGLASYKQHLFLLLFTVYFTAVAIEKFQLLNRFKKIKSLSFKPIISVIILSIIVNVISAFTTPYKEPYETFPVKEMDYILKNSNNKNPKVLADYGSSGYLMYRGAYILADGRCDPFITKQTRGLYGWNAFETSAYGMFTLHLPEVINYYKPDYVVLPKQKKKKNNDMGDNVITIQTNKVKERLGTPDYSGDYGDVWYVKDKNIKIFN